MSSGLFCGREGGGGVNWARKMALEQLMAMTAVWQRAPNHLVWVSPVRKLAALAALQDDQWWRKQFDFGQAKSYIMCDVALCFLGG